MHLITELTEDVKYLTEKSEDGKKKLFIEGTLLQAEVVNRNKRIYPLSVMENEVNRYINEKIKTNRSYGELNHPASPTINLDRVSHMFTELHKDGNNFVGRAKVLTELPMGKIVEGLIDAGANLGISSRALGSLKPRKDGIMEVQNDFRMATPGDIVSDPSGPEAFVQGIYEGAEWIINPDGNWKMIQAAEKVLEQVNKKFDESIAIKLFEDYLTKLTTR